MDIFTERTNIMKSILDIYKGDFEVLNAIKNGENLSLFLKYLSVVYPSEYNMLLNQKISDFKDVISFFSLMRDKLAEKQEFYNLYKNYVYYFLAGKVDDNDLSYKVCYGDIYNAVNSDGKIDYLPYLNNLGISDIKLLCFDCQGKEFVKGKNSNKLPFPGLL